MPDQPQALCGINWRETLPFTHIFRAFRIAIHPSKLALALTALLAIYFGGRILDGFWASSSRAVPDEIAMYESTSPLPLGERIAAARKQNHQQVAQRLVDLRKADNYDNASKLAIDSPGKAASHIEYEAKQALTKDVQKANDGHAEDLKKANAQSDSAKKEEALKAADAAHKQALRSAYDKARGEIRLADSLSGEGLFSAFFRYQVLQINKLWSAVLNNNWLGGLPGSNAPVGDGVLACTIKFFTIAPGWALRNHTLYFLIFGTWFLVIWSLFGGAIARIAAVHVADDGRKLSIRHGLAFSFSKFLSFVSAPLIPIIIIAVFGLVVAVAALLTNIPHLGPVITGAFFIIALIAGFVMTLVVLGMAGGFNLMYPTIAVEGTDSFDAISRSFSYVYARPWRMMLYSGVAIGYGSLTYLFIRVFIWLVLRLTWFWAGLLVFATANDGGALWNELFPEPSFTSLAYNVDMLPLSAGESIGSFLIAIWVYLVISMLGAFAISFYFSVNTIIYYLMRREVDATEMEDVYLEPMDEDFAETPAPGDAAPPASDTPAAANPV